MSEHKEQSLLSKIREAGVTLQGGRTPFQRTQGNAIVTWCDDMYDQLETLWVYVAKDLAGTMNGVRNSREDREAIWGGE